MSDFTLSHYVQLIIALSAAIAAFAFAYSSRQRTVLGILSVLIPFQLIASRYGSNNVVFIYIIGFAFLVRHRFRKVPMFSALFLVWLAYLLSATQVHKATYIDHIIYLSIMGSNYLMFLIMYNYVLSEANPRSFFNFLIAMNLAVIGYSCLKLLPGMDHYALFGINELTLSANKIKSHQLVGPFNAVGINAEYHVIQIFVMMYLAFFETRSRRKWLFWGLIVANFAFLVASGNRGGFFTLTFVGGLFYWLYRKELGFVKLVKINILITVVFLLISVFVIKLTRYDVLYDRILETELRDGMPDSRSGIWPIAWKEIKKKPILGHGPRLWLFNHWDRRYPGSNPIPYPHNLYLFLLYTLGIIGLIAYFVMFFSMFRIYFQASRIQTDDVFSKGLPKLGIIILVAFLIDQIKIEFLRFALDDFQHYIFMLFGAFVGFSHLIHKRSVPIRG